ncbi:MAG: peptidoglycan DD-metalloendopeptidase family protein [Ginsengibacter sp.]
MKLIKLTLHKPFLFFYIPFFCLNVSAQIFPVKKYPQGYFIYPVGAPVGLAANFGELRSNHYHMGLDCKTQKKENLPVYAAADGYVAKVKIEPGGFGRAIYINHPNGLTTLYGHLNNFFPALEKYVKEEQYRQESWKIFIDIPAQIFQIKKSDFIAFSGNTGGSQGPHLHFEIRDTETDKVLNPLLFGFEVKDKVPPSILRLAIYDRCISTYSQVPKLLSLKFVNGIYVPAPSLIIINSDRVSFGISAFDKSTGSSNNNGIYEAEIFDNNDAVAGFQLDSISYDETRYENAHIDYKLKLGGGSYVEHLSRLPGYPAGVYKDARSDGVINIDDDKIHSIKIVVKDTYGNTSVLQFHVQRGSAKTHQSLKDSSYFQQREFHPGFVNVFEKDDVQLILGEHDLYDSIRFLYAKKAASSPQAISELHMVHNGLVPVHGYLTLKLKSTFAIPDSLKDKIIMQRSWGGKTEVLKPKREARPDDPAGRGDWFTAQFRNFGNFQLLIDNLPPTISAIGIKDNANLTGASQIIFVFKDNNDQIKNFRAELDGKWLRFTNDKGRSFIYKFDEMCTPGSHELKVSVEDEAGNTATKVFHFTR